MVQSRKAVSVEFNYKSIWRIEILYGNISLTCINNRGICRSIALIPALRKCGSVQLQEENEKKKKTSERVCVCVCVTAYTLNQGMLVTCVCRVNLCCVESIIIFHFVSLGSANLARNYSYVREKAPGRVTKFGFSYKIIISC